MIFIANDRDNFQADSRVLFSLTNFQETTNMAASFFFNSSSHAQYILQITILGRAALKTDHVVYINKLVPDKSEHAIWEGEGVERDLPVNPQPA